IVDKYESNIINYYFETEYFSEVYNVIDGIKYNVSTHFVDHNLKDLKIQNQNEIMMSEDLEEIYEIGDQINIKLTDNFEKIGSGLYLPNYLINFTNYQTLNFEVSSDMVDILSNEIDKNIENLNIEIINSEEDYIIEVYREFEIIINLLTIFMFILTLLGIFNVSKVIIFESKPEIRILKSLGYSRNSINLIFSIITGLILVIGAVLAIPIAISMSNLSINIIGNTGFEVNNPITFDFLVVLRLVIVFVLAGSLITHIMTRDFIDRT
ncbi:MAG: FtsX-like permease family protein, partial [Candidatus Heimdallarchaeota archaeon]